MTLKINYNSDILRQEDNFKLLFVVSISFFIYPKGPSWRKPLKVAPAWLPGRQFDPPTPRAVSGVRAVSSGSEKECL